MEDILAQLKNHFPSLPPNALTKIYKARAERLRLMMIMGIPADVRWLIEAKVRLSGEFANGFISYMPGLGKSSFAKKRRAKRMGVCHKCGRETCNKRCRSLGWVSVNREDKIKFIKDGLSKESLDMNFIQRLLRHILVDLCISVLSVYGPISKKNINGTVLGI
jgi:hypothetical protein